MAKRDSIFGDEWRRCLVEHYKYVIKNDDKVTEATLLPILHNVGFTESELRRWYLEATLRADELPDNFMPDLEKVMDTAPAPVPAPAPPAPDATFMVHPAECTCPACANLVLDINHDADGQPLPAPEEAESETDGTGKVFAVAKPEEASDKPKPKQMSLF